MTIALHVRLAALLVASFATLAAQAQTTYRWTDPSGRTVYSDQPPPPGTRQVTEQKGAPPPDDAGMPYDVRVAAQNHPVRFYTSTACKEICQRGRALLDARGVPFTETVVNSPDELKTLSQELGSELSIPSLFVGRQSFQGFEAEAWTDLLDLAGYPKTTTYRRPPSSQPAPAAAQ